MKIERIADVPWSFMQYLRPALCYNLSLNQLLVFFLSGRLRFHCIYLKMSPIQNLAAPDVLSLFHAIYNNFHPLTYLFINYIQYIWT